MKRKILSLAIPMSPRGKIQAVYPYGELEYIYVILDEEGDLRGMRIDREVHIYAIETKGDIVGRYIEWDRGDKTFEILD